MPACEEAGAWRHTPAYKARPGRGRRLTSISPFFQRIHVFMPSPHFLLRSSSSISKLNSIRARMTRISVYARLRKGKISTVIEGFRGVVFGWMVLKRRGNLPFTKAIPRSVRKWLEDLLLVLGIQRFIAPALGNKLFGILEVARIMIGCPLRNSHGSLAAIATAVSSYT